MILPLLGGEGRGEDEVLAHGHYSPPRKKLMPVYFSGDDVRRLQLKSEVGSRKSEIRVPVSRWGAISGYAGVQVGRRPPGAPSFVAVDVRRARRSLLCKKPETGQKLRHPPAATRPPSAAKPQKSLQTGQNKHPDDGQRPS